MASRSRDVFKPFVEPGEPLSLELGDFVSSSRNGTQPVSSSEAGLDAVRLIEAAELSLTNNGSPVMVDTPPDDRRRSGDRRRSDGGMPATPSSGLIGFAP